MAKRKTKEQTTKYESTPIVLNVLSNDPSEYKYSLLQMFYDGAFLNQIGYMDAKHKTTGEIHRVLVGMQPNDKGSVDAFPIARLLEADEVQQYLAPDSKGGYGEYTPEE